MQLSEAITGYWLAKRPDFSKTTIPGYERTFQRLVSVLGNPDFAAITSSDIRRFLVHLTAAIFHSQAAILATTRNGSNCPPVIPLELL